MRQALSLWHGLIPWPNTMAEITSETAAKHGVTVEALKGPKAARAVSWPRQEAMWLMREAGFSLNQIGRYLGGRDHATVLYGARTHLARSESQ